MITLFRQALDRLVGPFDASRFGRVAPAESVDEVAFRNAMAGAVHGVSIVTTAGPSGRAGITVSSLVSASVTPPLVMFCIHRQARVLALIVRNGTFCVNLLAAHHRQLADIFAGRPQSGLSHDFDRATWIKGVTGSPSLHDAVAGLDCVLHRMVRVGTHQAILGRCVGVRTADGPALLYTERHYGTAITCSPEASATRTTQTLRTGEHVP